MASEAKARRSEGEQIAMAKHTAQSPMPRITPDQEIELATTIQKGVKIFKIKKELENELCRDPTNAEWSEEANLSKAELRRTVSNYRDAKVRRNCEDEALYLFHKTNSSLRSSFAPVRPHPGESRPRARCHTRQQNPPHRLPLPRRALSRGFPRPAPRGRTVRSHQGTSVLHLRYHLDQGSPLKQRIGILPHHRPPTRKNQVEQDQARRQRPRGGNGKGALQPRALHPHRYGHHRNRIRN